MNPIGTAPNCFRYVPVDTTICQADTPWYVMVLLAGVILPGEPQPQVLDPLVDGPIATSTATATRQVPMIPPRFRWRRSVELPTTNDGH